jgi:hypothetical protein
MATIVSQIEQELGLAPGGFAAAFGTEVRAIDAKIAVVRAERTKALEAFDAQLGELDTLRAEAQRRADEALGKV